jgi:hypothetical protein
MCRSAAVWYDMVWFRTMWCGHCQWRVVLCSLVMFRALAILWPRGSSLDVLRVRESVHMKDYEEWHTIYVSQSCHVMVVWLGVRVRLGALVFCGLYVRVRVCVCVRLGLSLWYTRLVVDVVLSGEVWGCEVLFGLDLDHDGLV